MGHSRRGGPEGNTAPTPILLKFGTYYECCFYIPCAKSKRFRVNGFAVRGHQNISDDLKNDLKVELQMSLNSLFIDVESFLKDMFT